MPGGRGLLPIRFNARESCGKCVPCRVGVHLVAAWERDMAEGKADQEALERLERSLSTMAAGRLLRIGAKVTAPLRLALKEGGSISRPIWTAAAPRQRDMSFPAGPLGSQATGAN